MMVGAMCAALGIATADTLRLKDGTVLQGTFLGGSAREVRFDNGENVRTYPVEQVRGIDFQSGSSSSNRDSSPEVPRLRRAAPVDSDSRPSYSESRPAYNDAQSYGGEVPAGTMITVRLIDTVDSRSAQLGQTFSASVDEPVRSNGQTLIPRGSDVVLKLVEDQQSGRIAGQTVLGLALASIRVNGRMVDFTSEEVQERSSSRGARSGKVIGGTAALGAILGTIAGGGRGAAIGAASGAAVGTGAEVATKGQRVHVPSESRLSFRVSSAVRM
jgi:hypothetical protein